jgi:hypothetical protein
MAGAVEIGAGLEGFVTANQMGFDKGLGCAFQAFIRVLDDEAGFEPGDFAGEAGEFGKGKKKGSLEIPSCPWIFSVYF